MAINFKIKATSFGGTGSEKFMNKSRVFLTRFKQHGNFKNKNSHIRHGNSWSTSTGHSHSSFTLTEINFILL